MSKHCNSIAEVKGLSSLSSLHFFQTFFLQLLKLCDITATIFYVFKRCSQGKNLRWAATRSTHRPKPCDLSKKKLKPLSKLISKIKTRTLWVACSASFFCHVYFADICPEFLIVESDHWFGSKILNWKLASTVYHLAVCEPLDNQVSLITCFLLMKIKVFPLNKVLLPSLGRKLSPCELIVSSFRGGR